MVGGGQCSIIGVLRLSDICHNEEVINLNSITFIKMLIISLDSDPEQQSILGDLSRGKASASQPLRLSLSSLVASTTSLFDKLATTR